MTRAEAEGLNRRLSRTQGGTHTPHGSSHPLRSRFVVRSQGELHAVRAPVTLPRQQAYVVLVAGFDRTKATDHRCVLLSRCGMPAYWVKGKLVVRGKVDLELIQLSRIAWNPN